MMPAGFLGSIGASPLRPSSIVAFPPHRFAKQSPACVADTFIASTASREVTSITAGGIFAPRGAELRRPRRRPRPQQGAQRRHEGERLVDHHVMLGLRNLHIRRAWRNEAQKIRGVLGMEELRLAAADER